MDMAMAMAGGVDRISDLPSEILKRILFFVGVRQAVQLSVLSSRWKDLWKSMPDLRFDARDFPSTGDQNWRLYSLARKIMMLRTERVRELRIVMSNNVDQSLKISASRWFNFAARCNADELSMSCLPWPSSPCISQDRKLFADTYHAIINFGILRSLTILCIHDNFNAFEPPSNALPLLETLSMTCCSFETINLSFSRLKVLTLHECDASPDKFYVATPSLESFDYSQSFSRICKLENMPSLKHVSIDISYENQCGDSLLGLFGAIQNASSINISWCTLETHSKLNSSFSCLPIFHGAKHMTLVDNGRRHIILTKDLMQKLPNIETLTIKAYSGFPELQF